MSHEVESCFSAREVPWHGLGTIVESAPSSAEAIKLAGLDWNVRQEEIVYKDQKSGYFMNIRESDDKVLGVVGGRYKPVQNIESFDFVDELLGEGVKYETAGSLTTGKRIWLLAKMPDYDILGDTITPYMCLTNSHDGFGSLKVFMTPVRVVCQNTLNAALSSAERMWNVRHTGDIGNKLTTARKTLGLAQKYMNALEKEAEGLAAIKIAPKDFKELRDTMFPITDDMSKRKEETQMLSQRALTQAWEMDDLGNIRGNGWGFLNAVSDMSTHKEPGRKTENAQENSFMYVIDSPMLLNQAYKLLLARK